MKVRFKSVLMPCKKNKDCDNIIDRNGARCELHIVSADNSIFINPKLVGWTVESSYGYVDEKTRKPFIVGLDYDKLCSSFFIEMEELTSKKEKFINSVKHILGFSSSKLKPTLKNGKITIIISK